MSETLEPMATEVNQKQLAEQLLAQAKEQGQSRWAAWMSTWSSPNMVPPT